MDRKGFIKSTAGWIGAIIGALVLPKTEPELPEDWDYLLRLDNSILDLYGGREYSGTYIGDGNESQVITGLGFQPKRIIVWNTNSNHAGE